MRSTPWSALSSCYRLFAREPHDCEHEASVVHNVLIISSDSLLVCRSTTYQHQAKCSWRSYSNSASNSCRLVSCEAPWANSRMITSADYAGTVANFGRPTIRWSNSSLLSLSLHSSLGDREFFSTTTPPPNTTTLAQSLNS